YTALFRSDLATALLICSLSTGSPSWDSSPLIIAAYTLSVAGAIRPRCAVFHSTTTPSYLSLHSSSSDLQPQGSAASSLTSHFVIAWSIMSATSPRGTLQRGSSSGACQIATVNT